MHRRTWTVTTVDGALRQAERGHGAEQPVDAGVLHAEAASEFATADRTLGATQHVQHFEPMAERLVRLRRHRTPRHAGRCT